MIIAHSTTIIHTSILIHFPSFLQNLYNFGTQIISFIYTHRSKSSLFSPRQYRFSHIRFFFFFFCINSFSGVEQSKRVFFSQPRFVLTSIQLVMGRFQFFRFPSYFYKNWIFTFYSCKILNFGVCFYWVCYDGSCYWWKIQTWEENWKWVIWRNLFGYALYQFLFIFILFFNYCIFCLNNLDFFDSGVNVQTQEEVAVKLVSEVVMDSCCMFWSFYDSCCYVFVFGFVNE